MSLFHKDAVKKLMPIDLEGDYNKDIETEGQILDKINSDLSDCMNELFPLRCSEINIKLFEETCGIKVSNKSIDERKTAIIAQLRSQGGISVEKIIEYANSLGYDIEIIENKPALCGDAECGESIISKYNIIWQFMIKIVGLLPTYFRAGESGAGEYLVYYNPDPNLLLNLNKVKPAYMYSYIGGENGEN